MRTPLFIFVVLFCASALQSFAETRDRLAVYEPVPFLADSRLKSTHADSTAPLADSTSRKNPDTTSTRSSIDTVVTYSAADSIVYSITSREMTLYKKGDMKYRDFKLDAGHIAINWDTSILTAKGTKDTADKIVEQPVFTDGGESYNGSHVSYDFKSQKGRVNVANTEIDKSYYHGELIKKYAKDVLYVENGRFTTCDKTDPDYYFQSSRMKLVVNDKIVAEPIIMYVDGVPVFALPFGVFPAKSGRRSGIITPSFGESADFGRYLSHFGYFWAINDYADLTTTADWWDRGKFDIKSGLRYNVRYLFNGSIYGGYAYQATGQPGDPGRQITKNWDLSITHNQTIDPNTSLTANVKMSSQNYFQTTALDYPELLQQNLVSDVSLFRSWPGSGNSASISIHRDQNLQNGSISATLPTISFSHTQSYPFRSSEHANTPIDQLSWYELIGYSYSGQFQNSISKQFDSTVAGDYNRSNLYGVQHSVSISASPKIGFFTLSPYVSITDKMYDSRTIYNDIASSTGKDSLISEKQHGFYNIGYFSTGVQASTRLFGIMQPNIFGITAFRHTLQPSVTVSYQPDFSKSFWGYYGRYRTLSDSEITYDHYPQQNAIYGGAPSGQFGGMTFGLSNNFEMKTRSSDTSQTENKIQLLNLDANMSYNFLARGSTHALSDLSVNYRTNIAGKVDIGGGGIFSFYQYDYASNTRINKLLLSEGRIADLTNFNLNLSTSFQGQRTQRSSAEQPGEADSIRSERQYNIFYQQIQPPDLSIPWNLRLGFNYSLIKPKPDTSIVQASLQYDLGFNLTENWKIGFTGGYDFIRHQVVVPAVTVYRDLHCWEMTLRWNPIGYLRGFNLEIRIKAPQLSDIKITKREYQNIGF